jgi:hypothetical protein
MHDEEENGRAITMRTEPARLGTRTPAPARAMPPDFSISVRAKRAADRLIAESGGERTQPMRGYEDTFTDIVDYILRVTHRIWEEKAIGYLYEHYAPNARVFQDDGIVYGRERVIADTTQTIGAFPDLKLHADDSSGVGTRTPASGRRTGSRSSATTRAGRRGARRRDGGSCSA